MARERSSSLEGGTGAPTLQATEARGGLPRHRRNGTCTEAAPTTPHPPRPQHPRHRQAPPALYKSGHSRCGRGGLLWRRWAQQAARLASTWPALWPLAGGGGAPLTQPVLAPAPGAGAVRRRPRRLLAPAGRLLAPAGLRAGMWCKARRLHCERVTPLSNIPSIWRERDSENGSPTPIKIVLTCAIDLTILD